MSPQPITASILAALPGVRHGFFGREGGVSDGIYASLNCGLGSRDEPERVLENRARVCDALGGRGRQVVTVHQVHSATAVAIDGPIARDALPHADGVVTRTPGLVIAALAADCAPVLFADAEARVVGAAHAGWRGAVGGVAEATIAAMEGLGARRANIRAAVGPCITQPAYEVGEDFRVTVLGLDPTAAGFFAAGPAKPHFDLPGYLGARLGRAGLAEVVVTALCTFENESNYFSYRRSQKRKEPDYGRHISAIVLAQ